MRNKEFPRFQCMDDCIHLKACRRVQKIGRSLHLNVPRYCSEDCSAYEPAPEEIIVGIEPADVMKYIYDNAYMIREGYDEYDVFAPQDLAPYEFNCIKYDESEEGEAE